MGRFSFVPFYLTFFEIISILKVVILKNNATMRLKIGGYYGFIRNDCGNV